MTSKRYKPIPRAPIRLLGDYWVPDDHPFIKNPQCLAVANQGIKQYEEALRTLGGPQDDASNQTTEIEQ